VERVNKVYKTNDGRQLLMWYEQKSTFWGIKKI
jgi:hypothetical protein